MSDRLKSFDNTRIRRGGHGGGAYSWFVRILRLALPVGAIILIGIVIARLNADPKQMNIADLPKEETTSAGNIQLEGARYEGVDKDGRAYALSAAEGSRDPADPKTVLMTKPEADITLSDGSWLSTSAETGRYNDDEKHLTLIGNVRVFHDGGNEMQLQDVDINILDKTAVSGKPVEAQGPAGTLKAQGMEVLDGGATVVFKGPATLTLYRLGGKG